MARRRRKKSYNPFKMWGSYVGAFLLPLSIFIPFLNKITRILIYPFARVFLSGCNDWGCIMFILPISLIPGFLIGWLIHSLFRRFSK